MNRLINPQAELIKKQARTIAVGTILLIAYGLALVGAMYLMSQREPTTASSCDRIQTHDGTLWCMAKMQQEDDNITIVRGDYGN